MTITPLYAGLLAFWYLALTAAVIHRRRRGISLGDGGDANMLRVIRGHGNFAEFVPLALILMALLESGKASPTVLHALGGTLLVGRLLHGYALSFTPRFMFGRFWGALLTFVVIGAAAALCLLQAVRGGAPL